MNSPDLSEKMLIVMHKTDVIVTAMRGSRCLRFMERFLSITYLTAILPCSGLVVHLTPPVVMNDAGWKQKWSLFVTWINPSESCRIPTEMSNETKSIRY